jgi:hypothetical protein
MRGRKISGNAPGDFGNSIALAMATPPLGYHELVKNAVQPRCGIIECWLVGMPEPQERSRHHDDQEDGRGL